MRVALAQDSEKSAEHCNAPMPVSHAAEHSIDMRFEVHGTPADLKYLIKY